eukprot:2712264-Alexandrium_andersonii.AAC.1
MAGRVIAAPRAPRGPSISPTVGALSLPATTCPATASASSFQGWPAWPLMWVKLTRRLRLWASTRAAVQAARSEWTE